MILLKASSALASQGIQNSEGNIGYYKDSSIKVDFNQAKTIGIVD